MREGILAHPDAAKNMVEIFALEYPSAPTPHTLLNVSDHSDHQEEPLWVDPGPDLFATMKCQFAQVSERFVVACNCISEIRKNSILLTSCGIGLDTAHCKTALRTRMQK